MPRLADPSDLVRLEVETALATPGVSVIPLWVMRATSSPQDISALPESLRPMFDNNGMSIRPVPDEEGDIQRLIGRITAQLDKEQSDSIYFAGRSYYPRMNAFYQETLSSQMHLQEDLTSLQRRQTKRR